MDYPEGILASVPYRLVSNLILQRTTHGWHLYTDAIMTLEQVIEHLTYMGADPAWIDIGKERGYYFLADKKEIDFPWPVEHMVIHYGKRQKARNSKTSRLSIREEDNNSKTI